MTTDTTHWLTEHTRRGEIRGGQEWSHAPFAIEIDGKRWSGATTGQYAVLIRADLGFPPIPVDREAVLRAEPPGETSVELDAFREWVAVPGPEECSACCSDDDADEGAIGSVTCPVCDGLGEHYCSTCDTNHHCACCDGMGKTECKTCGGTGVVSKPQPGILFGNIIVDRRFFAATLAHLEGDGARLWTGGVAGDAATPVVLSTPDWRVIVMPMRVEPGAALPAWPVAVMGAADSDEWSEDLRVREFPGGRR